MEYRPLKINVASAEGLKNVNLFSKMDVYAEVSIDGYPRSKQRTFVDKASGTRPKWNHRMEFVVDEPYLTKPGLVLLFQLKARSTFGGGKEIGSVTVPIDDLFQGNTFGEERFLDYQVRTKSGKAMGVLKISFSFGEKFSQETIKHVDPMAAYPNKHADEPMTAYPPAAYPNKHADEPVTAYPAAVPPYSGTSYAQYPPAGYPASSSGYGYQAPPQGYGYPPQQGYGGYGYPPGTAGYGGYPPVQAPKKNKFGGAGLGLGLGAGLLGGLLIGDMVGDAAGYADGYGDAMGGMDF